MLVKWETKRRYGAKIDRVECSRETDKAVWVLERPWSIGGKSEKPPIERRRLRNSDGSNFHDTWEDARDFLMDQANDGVLSARDALERAHDFLGNVKGLRKPAEPHEMPEQDVRA